MFPKRYFPDAYFGPRYWDKSSGTPAPPVADFTGTPVSGNAPLAVTFTDLSTNTPTSWSWTFGDGGTSTLQNPTHTYTVAGTYTVALTATNAQGSDTKTRTAYITVSAPVPTTQTASGGGGGGSSDDKYGRGDYIWEKLKTEIERDNKPKSDTIVAERKRRQVVAIGVALAMMD